MQSLISSLTLCTSSARLTGAWPCPFCTGESDIYDGLLRNVERQELLFGSRGIVIVLERDSPNILPGPPGSIQHAINLKNASGTKALHSQSRLVWLTMARDIYGQYEANTSRIHTVGHHHPWCTQLLESTFLDTRRMCL